MSIPNARPLDAHGMAIDDLFDEAKNFLDGQPIATQGQADEIGLLRDRIREQRKAADERRKAEKESYAAQVKAIDAEWKPLLEKCELATGACNDALAPWLQHVEAEQRAIAAQAARDAAEQRQRAQEALAGAGENLAARVDAETLLKAADKSERDAAKLDKAKPQVAGQSRAIGLRTFYRAEIIDALLFARWAWTNRRSEYDSFLADLAEREARRGPVSIPGLTIHTERKAA